MSIEDAVEYLKSRGYEPVAVCAYDRQKNAVLVLDLSPSEVAKQAFSAVCQIDEWVSIVQ